jgi:WXG100 family type VII secretion target
MSFFMMNIPGVESAIQMIKAQHQVVQSASDMAKQAQATVMGSWIGGDEQAFDNAVKTKLLPAYVQLAMAIAGFGTNLNTGIDIMNQADKQVKKFADQFGSLVQKIKI